MSGHRDLGKIRVVGGLKVVHNTACSPRPHTELTPSVNVSVVHGSNSALEIILTVKRDVIVINTQNSAASVYDLLNRTISVRHIGTEVHQNEYGNFALLVGTDLSDREAKNSVIGLKGNG